MTLAEASKHLKDCTRALDEAMQRGANDETLLKLRLATAGALDEYKRAEFEERFQPQEEVTKAVRLRKLIGQFR